MNFYGKAKETADLIVSAFEHPERLPSALAPIFIHKQDATPCRAWSFRNQFLVALAGTDDARGFKQWNQVDRKVSKGSKCFHILAPCMAKRKDAEGNEVSFPTGFRSVPVFRLEDTEGAPIERDESYDSFLNDLPLRSVADAWSIPVELYNGANARNLGWYRYTILDDRPIAIGLGVENISTFLHELTHAADHKLGTKKETGQHWRSETVAELGSSILAECIGMTVESDRGGCFSYIESYAKAADKTVQSACMEVLDRTCQCVALILDTAETLAAERVTA